jgi:hypothetical protein
MYWKAWVLPECYCAAPTAFSRILADRYGVASAAPVFNGPHAQNGGIMSISISTVVGANQISKVTERKSTGGGSPADFTSYLNQQLADHPIMVRAPAADSTGPTYQASTTPTVDGLYKQADASGDGLLSRGEFVNFDAAMHPNGPHLTEATTGIPVDGSYMFAIIDRARQGLVSLAQVKEHGYLLPETDLRAADL